MPDLGRVWEGILEEVTLAKQSILGELEDAQQGSG